MASSFHGQLNITLKPASHQNYYELPLIERLATGKFHQFKNFSLGCELVYNRNGTNSCSGQIAVQADQVRYGCIIDLRTCEKGFLGSAASSSHYDEARLIFLLQNTLHSGLVVASDLIRSPVLKILKRPKLAAFNGTRFQVPLGLAEGALLVLGSGLSNFVEGYTACKIIE